MQEINFDFKKIHNMDDFYAQATNLMELPKHFGNNLDALWDIITGETELPLRIRFSNFKEHELDRFFNLIKLMEDAEEELEDEFFFKCDYSFDEDEEYYGQDLLFE